MSEEVFNKPEILSIKEFSERYSISLSRLRWYRHRSLSKVDPFPFDKAIYKVGGLVYVNTELFFQVMLEGNSGNENRI